MRGVNERHAATGAAGEVAPQLICVVSQDRMRLARLREPLPSLAELRHDLAERIVDPITGNPAGFQIGLQLLGEDRNLCGTGASQRPLGGCSDGTTVSGIEDTVCALSPTICLELRCHVIAGTQALLDRLDLGLDPADVLGGGSVVLINSFGDARLSESTELLGQSVG